MKRIIICCDGTWNWPDKDQDGFPTATNVVKLAEAITDQGDDGVRQVVYYDTGIGASGGLISRCIDGATGRGLSRNILEAYRYLIGAYELGDELFFFGFSRGAFTVRSLVGLVRTCGILRPDAAHKVDDAYTIYRTRRPVRPRQARAAAGMAAAGEAQGQPRERAPTEPEGREARLFRRNYAVADRVPVKFMGVWDTVGSLGNPLWRSKLLNRKIQFHDTDLSSTVQNAFHALAIDEKRRSFRATLWHQRLDENGQVAAPEQILEQVWFVGVHSQVGGGFPHPGLSDIPLGWMVDRARQYGAGFNELELQGDYLAKTAEPGSIMFLVARLFPHHRPMAKPDPKNPKLGPANETLHPTVLARYREDPTYRPKNLEDYFQRFPHLRPS